MNLPILFYLLPMTAVASLVYSASRFEDTHAILTKSVRLFIQITLFLAGILLVLYFLTARL
ncbi:MAG: hypothetical protein KDA78_19260 [Planctomycetaceae bacterium]|nr:hypothetical protein [Planctomycetaceae bacterium]